MKINNANIRKKLGFASSTLVALTIGVLGTSCAGDFLDRKPKDAIQPESFYTTADQLSTFTIKQYETIFSGVGGWNGGVAIWDNGTDNQAAVNANLSMFTPDRWQVPGSGDIGFNTIRDLNKFISEKEQKKANGEITGSEADINQAIGEAYAIRAMQYYNKLRTYGDFPIVEEVLNEKMDLANYSKRQPRNEVARYILKNLDKAYELVKETTPRNQRISKRAVLVLKSRVALYEATFEKYHAGSGRVPGDANWPGKDKEWNKGKTFDINAEVDFFLTEAMDAAKKVGDAIPLKTPNTHVMNPSDPNQYAGWNPYFHMFSSPDLSIYPEVILWEEFSPNANKMHRTANYIGSGFNSGWTRSLVESFLMKNGKPIYANASGYQGDESIDEAKKGRDERLQLFVFGESTLIKDTIFGAPGIINIAQNRDVTGYRQRKFYNYDPAKLVGTAAADDSGIIHIRVEEAYLNYMEASYLKTGALDATARKYWDALRKRAGITEPIETTISNTNMSYEADVNRPSYDWGAFSAGVAVDPTLYSIRRERRCELAGEGYRMDDLKRWRAMDQVKGYHIEGVNLWDEMYKDPAYIKKDEKTKKEVHQLIGKFSDGGEDSKVSSKELSKYLRPYQIRNNYDVYNGLTFYEAHYLSPFSVEEMQLSSPNGTAEDSYLYQNIYWPTYGGGKAEK